MDLRERLVKFAWELASATGYDDCGDYEPSIETRIASAIAYSKYEIGRSLLDALDTKPEEIVGEKCPQCFCCITLKDDHAVCVRCGKTWL